MKQQELGISEQRLDDSPLDPFRDASLSYQLPPVQAFEDSPAGPAGIVVAPLRSLDDGRSMSGNDSTADEPAERGPVRWLAEFREVTRLQGPDPLTHRFVAGDGMWMLWRKRVEKGGDWRSYMLYLLHEAAVKRVWSFGWSREEVRMSDTRDTRLLKLHHPQVYEWVRRVALQGAERAGPVPSVKVMSPKEWRRRKRSLEGGKYDEYRRQYQRERYQRLREKRVEEVAQADIPDEAKPVVMLALQQLWQMKRPLSLRKQAPAERYAPAILAQNLSLPEEQVKAWLKRQVAEGRIAEEMISTKTKMRGLRVLGVSCEEAKRPSSEKPEV
jgi:hypothetical protein